MDPKNIVREDRQCFKAFRDTAARLLDVSVTLHVRLYVWCLVWEVKSGVEGARDLKLKKGRV